MFKLNEVINKKYINSEEYLWLIEQNNLGLSGLKLELEEERISKVNILKLYTSYGENLKCEFGTFESFLEIHEYILGELYPWAGKIRNINISKGNTNFLPVNFLNNAIIYFNTLANEPIDVVIEKYSELNVIHPCYEGNGRAGRIWLDLTLYYNHQVMIDWSNISVKKYLYVMEMVSKNPEQIKLLVDLFKENLITEFKVDIFFNMTDISARYEGQKAYLAKDLYNEYIVNE